MRLASLLLLFLGTCFWMCPAAGALDLYVNNQHGSDLHDGLSEMHLGGRQGPFRTIERALRAASNGDRLIIANTGTAYRESLTLQADRHSGVTARPFVVVGNGAVLDGSMPVPLEAWEVYEAGVYRFRAERKSSHNLFLDGKPVSRRRAPPLADSPPQLDEMQWCLFEGHVYFRPQPGKSPWAYQLTHTALPVGLTLYEVRHVIIQDLIVQGFQLDGINAHDGAVDVELVGLTCRGNGRSGMSIGGASRVTIEACLVGDNGEAQIRTEGFCRARLVNCDLIDHPAAPALDQQGGQVDVERRVARATVSDDEAPR
jgi:hypothetical protein